MDRDLILSKLDSLQRCVARVRSKTPASRTELEADPDAQDIIAVNLERAVQLCVDIAFHVISDQRTLPVPETMADGFRALVRLGILKATDGEDLVRAVGFRNVSVHAYTRIDWGMTFHVITRNLPLFERYAKAILAHAFSTT